MCALDKAHEYLIYGRLCVILSAKNEDLTGSSITQASKPASLVDEERCQILISKPFALSIGKQSLCQRMPFAPRL
jgi:hypothetical protein